MCARCGDLTAIVKIAICLLVRVGVRVWEKQQRRRRQQECTVAYANNFKQFDLFAICLDLEKLGIIWWRGKSYIVVPLGIYAGWIS